ncbi:hypothetical protein [Georgenia satyanarayanai]|uniref:hypothetical protein n=1 Tax=Georgenia satyanarayanai TaxID=860221 RepID=UPI001264E0B4|nr:hypothetical protein [Georgenia satyanarayanai]
MADFRSQRMPSPDGEGVARGRWGKAWDVYSQAVRKVADPVAAPVVRPMARGATFDLLGFWLAWHTCGGFEGLQSQLGMSRSAVYRRVSAFRKAFGQHPDVFEFPGVSIDLDAFVAASGRAEASPGA